MQVCRTAHCDTVTREKVTEGEKRRLGGRAQKGRSCGEALVWGRACEEVLVWGRACEGRARPLFCGEGVER